MKLSRKSKVSAQKSGKHGGRGKSEGSRKTQFQKGNLHQFKSRDQNSGEIDSRINIGGRPKLLGESYKQWLAQINEQDRKHRTNAELGAIAMGDKMLSGDVQAAREIRTATEGDTVHLATWQTEIVEALRASKLTAEEVIKELGLEDARPILIAAGQVVPEGASSEATSEAAIRDTAAT